ncbi:MAG: peptidylprolyl isomerase [Bacteroidota bacterium]
MRMIFFKTFVCIILVSGSGIAQALIDRIVAVVDKEIITESELNERVQFVAFQNRMDPKAKGIHKQVLDGMVTEKLLLAQAKLDSIEVKEDEITAALDQQILNFVRQVGSEQRVEQMYGKSIARIKREYRDDIKNQLLVQHVRQQHEEKLSVSRREVEEFFAAYKDSLPAVPEEFTISHIYLIPKADSALETKTRSVMQSIEDSIRAGGDFADFAKRYSADGTAEHGGDLGWAKRGDYVHDFEVAAFGLKEGELSSIVRTPFGFHIIQLLGRRGESIHVRHILMRIVKGAASDSAAKDTLRNLKKRILAGESFAELAKIYSDDPDTKAIGGDLGTLTPDQMTKEFLDRLKELKSGEISEPLQTSIGVSYGYHIIWMRKRVESHTMNLKDDYRRVEQLALYMKKNKANEEWIAELKKNIYIDIRYQE